MNIDDGIKLKKLLKKLIWLFHKFYKQQSEIQDDLEHTGDLIVKILHRVVKEIDQHSLERYQGKWFREPLELALWISAKDTAYEEQRDYAIYKILTEYRDQLLSVLEDKRKIIDFTNPDNWHSNRWHVAKQKTQELRQKGVITSDMMSGMEAQFVNEKHIEDAKKYKKQNKKR